jgi:ribonuclease-3
MSELSTLQSVEELVGHRFADAELFKRAMSHASLDVDAGLDNERLEFLGDRILGFVVAEALVEAFPKAREGELALRLNATVRRESCAAVGRALDLGRHLRLAKSEESTGGREKPAILADACEALIAAIYLDGGFDAARQFVRRHFGAIMAESHAPPRDAKTALQEWAQAKGRPLPQYAVIDRTGPDHAPTFTIEVSVDGIGHARATGTSRRTAEQAAADALLSNQGLRRPL